MFGHLMILEFTELARFCPMMELGWSIVTLGISSAGQNRDRFTSAGEILEEFPGVLSRWKPCSSHARPCALSPTKNEIKRIKGKQPAAE